MTAKWQVERARIEDVEHLIRLYTLVYGNTYPVKYGVDPEAARSAILSPEVHWYIVRDPSNQRPIASIIIDLDVNAKLGRVIALLVHPDFSGKGLASQLLATGCTEVYQSDERINSLYATTRTNSISPQQVFLKNGFHPFGIFPNSHKLRQYETLTLFVRHRPGILERRQKVESAPEGLRGLLSIIQNQYGIETTTRLIESPKRSIREMPDGDLDLRFEFIFAPKFVQRRFLEKFNDPYDRFFPFHKPNFLIVSANGDIEAYAHVNKQDHYCAIVGMNVPIYSLQKSASALLDRLKEYGISYIELLLGLEHGRSIDTAIAEGFVPSAIYPAMRENAAGEMQDFVILSRTSEPLNFRGMAIDSRFKPFIDQYLQLWKKQALESLEVIDGNE